MAKGGCSSSCALTAIIAFFIGGLITYFLRNKIAGILSGAGGIPAS